MSRLIAFGDSFTYGSDLEDCIETSVGKEPEKYINTQYKEGIFGGPYQYETDIENKIRPGNNLYSLNTWPALSM